MCWPSDNCDVCTARRRGMREVESRSLVREAGRKVGARRESSRVMLVVGAVAWAWNAWWIYRLIAWGWG